MKRYIVEWRSGLHKPWWPMYLSGSRLIVEPERPATLFCDEATVHGLVDAELAIDKLGEYRIITCEGAQ